MREMNLGDDHLQRLHRGLVFPIMQARDTTELARSSRLHRLFCDPAITSRRAFPLTLGPEKHGLAGLLDRFELAKDRNGPKISLLLIQLSSSVTAKTTRGTNQPCCGTRDASLR